MLTRRGIEICAVLLAVTMLTVGCGGAKSRFDTHLKRGQAYFSQADFTRASVEFRNAMQIEPQNNDARLMAGRAAERLGHPRDAVGLYQAVVDSAPDNVEARADLGRVFILGGAPDQALKVIEPGLTAHPDDVALLTLRSAARSQQSNLQGAVADADRALQLAPANEEAIEVRAGLYKQVRDFPAAIALVGGAVSKLPASAKLREVLAELYMSAGEPQKAEEQLRALIKLAPQEPRYRYQLAIYYSRGRRLDEAQRVLEDAVKVLPKNDQVKLALVDFVTTQRTRAQGEQVLRGFIAQDPNNYDLRLGLGGLLERSGAMKEATDAYGEVVQRDGTGPKGLVARDRLANIAWTQGRYDDARKLIGQVLEKSAHDPDALSLRAEIELMGKDPAAAIGDLRSVLRDQPQAVGLRRRLARAFLANGQPALAEESLRAAMDLAPTDISLRIDLAKLFKQTQRVDQAIALLEEAVRKAPTDTDARVELTSAYLVKRDFAAAQTAAHDLQTLHPDSPVGFYLAGLAAEGQNQTDIAQKDYQQALAIQPRAFEILAALARLEQRLGQGAQAVVLVKDAVEHEPSSAPDLNLLGELYMVQQKMPLSIDALTRSTKLAGQWPVPYRNLALAKLAMSDSAGAIEAYQAGIKAAPEQVQLVAELALIYERHGRVDDSIALYEASYRQNPHSQALANNLAMLLVTYKTDRASLDRARDLSAAFASSTDGNFLDTNGWVRFKRGEYTEALPVLERAAARSPDSRQVRYHLGMAELHMGQTARARSDLEAALTGSANFAGSDEARATLAALKDRAG